MPSQPTQPILSNLFESEGLEDNGTSSCSCIKRQGIDENSETRHAPMFLVPSIPVSIDKAYEWFGYNRKLFPLFPTVTIYFSENRNIVLAATRKYVRVRNLLYSLDQAGAGRGCPFAYACSIVEQNCPNLKKRINYPSHSWTFRWMPRGKQFLRSISIYTTPMSRFAAQLRRWL